MCWGARALKTAIKKTTPPNKNENKKNKKKAIADYQAAEYAFSASLNLLNTVQSAIMFAGVGGGMLLVTASVAAGGASVGDVVLEDVGALVVDVDAEPVFDGNAVLVPLTDSVVDGE